MEQVVNPFNPTFGCYDPSMVDEGMKTHFYVIMEGFFYESKNYSAHY